MRDWYSSRTPEELAAWSAQQAYDAEYSRRVGGMSRKERRTLVGRVAVAEAKVSALEAKLRVLEMHQTAASQRKEE